MRSEELRNRIRGLLEEDTPAFWSDEEIFRALSAAQRNAAAYIIRLFKNRQSGVLLLVRNLICTNVKSGLTDSVVTHPEDMLLPVLVRYAVTEGERVLAFLRTESEYEEVLLGNTFAKATEREPVAVLRGDAMLLFPVPQNGSVELLYLRRPGSIDEAAEPEVSEEVDEALLFLAAAELLTKDKQHQEAEVMRKRAYEHIGTVLNSGE